MDIPVFIAPMIVDPTDLPRRDIRLICGVYFLYAGDELVYIGQSKNVVGRVASHCSDEYKEFTTYSFIDVPYHKLREVEAELISKYRPRYNKAGVT